MCEWIRYRGIYHQRSNSLLLELELLSSIDFWPRWPRCPWRSNLPKPIHRSTYQPKGYKIEKLQTNRFTYIYSFTEASASESFAAVPWLSNDKWFWVYENDWGDVKRKNITSFKLMAARVREIESSRFLPTVESTSNDPTILEGKVYDFSKICTNPKINQ